MLWDCSVNASSTIQVIARKPDPLTLAVFAPEILMQPANRFRSEFYRESTRAPNRHRQKPCPKRTQSLGRRRQNRRDCGITGGAAVVVFSADCTGPAAPNQASARFCSVDSVLNAPLYS